MKRQASGINGGLDLAAAAAVVILLLACCAGGGISRGSDSSTSAADTVAAPAPTDLTAEAQRWADSVCARLPLRRRVAQLFMPAIYASGDIWTLRRLREYADSGLCGVILLKGDIAGARMLADTMCCRSAVAPFISIDAEWGLAMRLVDAPEFPANNAIDPDVDDRVMYEYGRELARECRHLGINMVLGPVVDVSSSPNSFMRRRSFGADPHRVADMGVAYARGLEAGGVLGVAKHFPGHGSVSVDSHKQTGIISRSLHEMDSVDLYPFRQWIDNGLSAVMVGHLAVPSIDSEMLPAAVSPVVINDLLRDDLGFRGLVLTDALNMKGVRGYDAA
ncbi:MAG: beta-N-acetylglucosaminidase, partial [Muribaculaceae bacterium]|nr:beta-N-acetylglucosaminidase [Muribaculaceae bacterium]